jgi:hypothetical protein
MICVRLDGERVRRDVLPGAVRSLRGAEGFHQAAWEGWQRRSNGAKPLLLKRGGEEEQGGGVTQAEAEEDFRRMSRSSGWMEQSWASSRSI